MTNCNARCLTVGERVGGVGAGIFMKTQERDAWCAEPMRELDRGSKGSGLSSRKVALRCS